MNFQLLNKALSRKKKKQQFDPLTYINKSDIMSKGIDLYFLNEPIKLLESIDRLDEHCSIASIELNIDIKDWIEDTL